MRKLWLFFNIKNICFLLLIAFAGCKDKPTPDPFDSDINSVIKEFKIPGVSDENIRLIKNQISVKLPANYPYGKVIKLVIKLNNQFVLLTDISQGLQFEGQNMALDAKSDLYGGFTCAVYVTPTTPLKLASGTSDINISISLDANAQIPVTNVGTLLVEGDNGELAPSPRLTLKNTLTGQIVECPSWIFRDETAAEAKLYVSFPIDISAADYHSSVQWGSREADLPNLIKVKYGKLVLNFFPCDQFRESRYDGFWL